MKILMTSIKFFIATTLLCGLIYPLVVWILYNPLFAFQAEGSLLCQDVADPKKCIGSELIAQKTTSAKYFWPRPSAIDYNPLFSGGSNLSPSSATLQQQIHERENQGLSMDLLTGSASGLDPHVSPLGALSQLERVAKNRQLDENGKKKLYDIIIHLIEPRQFGILGEPRVNVLKLNLAVDKEVQ